MITSSGLNPCQKFDVQIGCTYYMGTSSTPDVVHILDVGPSSVTYARTYRGVARSDDRRIVDALIATGCATILARRKVLNASSSAYAIKGQKIYESRIGALRPSSDFDHYTVIVRPVGLDEQTAWYAAEEYGGVCGLEDTLEIECQGKEYDDLRKDERFVIVSEKCTHRAPLSSIEEKAIDQSAAEESARRSV